MPTSSTIWSFVAGAAIFFVVGLVFIYQGRAGRESSLRCGADMAIWAVVLICGIYAGLAIVNDSHVYARVELVLNGVLIATLMIMRWQNVSQRLAFAILLIGLHGLWDVLHLFELPLANDLVPNWHAWSCGILYLGYFILALPIFMVIMRFGRVNINK